MVFPSVRVRRGHLERPDCCHRTEHTNGYGRRRPRPPRLRIFLVIVAVLVPTLARLVSLDLLFLVVLVFLVFFVLAGATADDAAPRRGQGGWRKDRLVVEGRRAHDVVIPRCRGSVPSPDPGAQPKARTVGAPGTGRARAAPGDGHTAAIPPAVPSALPPLQRDRGRSPVGLRPAEGSGVANALPLSGDRETTGAVRLGVPGVLRGRGTMPPSSSGMQTDACAQPPEHVRRLHPGVRSDDPASKRTA